MIKRTTIDRDKRIFELLLIGHAIKEAVVKEATSTWVGYDAIWRLRYVYLDPDFPKFSQFKKFTTLLHR